MPDPINPSVNAVGIRVKRKGTFKAWVEGSEVVVQRTDKSSGWKQTLMLVAVPAASGAGNESVSDPIIKRLSEERDAILADLEELKTLRSANGGGGGEAASGSAELNELRALRRANGKP